MIASIQIIFQYIYLAPVLVAVLIPVCLISTYLIAVGNGHIEPIFPMVSDAGTRPPAAPVFSLLLNAIAFFLCITLFVRYIQIETIVESVNLCEVMSINIQTKNRIKMLNKISITISAMVCISLVGIACVRSGEMLEFHMTVGIPLFGGIPLLYVIQTWISHQTIPAVNSKFTANYRLLLTLLSIIFLFVYLTLSLWSFLAFKKDWKRDRMQWKREDGGYVQHVMANACEWLTLLTPTLFVYTFAEEFKRLELSETKFHFNPN